MGLTALSPSIAASVASLEPVTSSSYTDRAGANLDGSWIGSLCAFVPLIYAVATRCAWSGLVAMSSHVHS